MKKTFAWIIISLLFLGGCGYKPTTTYTKEALGENIYAEVQILRSDPKSSVSVQDAINSAVLSRFKANLTSRQRADTVLNIKFNGLSFTPLQYDRDGYAVYYQATVRLLVDYETPHKSGTFNVSGSYEFAVESSSVITDAKRSEALREGSLDALDEFVSRLALEGIDSDNSDNH